LTTDCVSCRYLRSPVEQRHFLFQGFQLALHEVVDVARLLDRPAQSRLLEQAERHSVLAETLLALGLLVQPSDQPLDLEAFQQRSTAAAGLQA
jgi:hypothetical protein